MSGFDSSRDALLRAILERATTDQAFRRQLLDNPHEAISKTFGVKVLANFRLRFIEKDPELDALIVLPDFRESDELDEDDLREVAGGTDDGADWTPPPA